MKWDYIPAEVFCDSVRDGTHNTPKPTNSGYKLVTSKHIKEGRIDPSDAYYISEEDYNEVNKRSLVEQWDVLLSMVGTVGEVALVKEVPDYAIKNVALFKCGGSELKGRWLCYYLTTPTAKAHMFGNQRGSSQQFISLSQLRKMPILTSDTNYMKTVVRTLSAYDDLIENNRKQIKLLEEAAQRLYKEWFIDLRFPGHENTPIIDGVPEGWKRVTLGDIECTLETGSRPKGGIDMTLKEGIPSIGAENVIGLGKYNFSAEKYITREFFLGMARGIVKNRDILIYKDGAYIGRTSLFQDGFPHKDATVNEHVYLLHAKNETLQYYLFLTLYQKEYFYKMQSLNKNAAQPGLNTRSLKSLDVMLPSADTITAFDRFIRPIMNLIFALSRQCRCLELARDYLLPKLMNGELTL